MFRTSGGCFMLSHRRIRTATRIAADERGAPEERARAAFLPRCRSSIARLHESDERCACVLQSIAQALAELRVAERVGDLEAAIVSFHDPSAVR